MSVLINMTGADEHSLGADEPGLSRTVLCQAKLFHHPVKGLERPNSTLHTEEFCEHICLCRRTKVRRHGQNSQISLLDLPDPLLENIITQAEPKAACFLGCTCHRLQALFMEHEPRHLAAMARGGICRFEVCLFS